MSSIVVSIPGLAPQVSQISLTAENLQGLIGGYLEALPLGRLDVVAFADEEGKLKRRSVNTAGLALYESLGGDALDFIAGPVVFCGMDEEGVVQALPQETVEQLLLVKLPEPKSNTHCN